MKALIQEKILKNPFVRRVSVLVGGTALGQLIAILALPILTRLYGPEAFSVLAVYSSVLSLITVIACLRLEIAIPLPKSDRMAAALCVLAITSVIFFTLLTTVFIAIFPDIFNTLTDNKISHFLWLLPIGVLAIGLYNTLQYWSTRRKKFHLIAKTRITQSLSGTIIKLIVGIINSSWTAGLIIGQVISQGTGFISLSRSLLKNDWQLFKKIKPAYLKATLKKYKNFPKYSTLEAFANVGGIQIPIILIAYYSADAEAGYLMVAMQLLSAPMSLIGNSVAQVYLSEGAERHHHGELRKFTIKTIINLAKISFIPLFLIALLAPFLMPYFLGEDWQRTGKLISWMAPWFFMQFITSPVSMALHITGNQKIAFILQFTGLFLRVGLVLIAINFYNIYIGEYYAISGACFYFIYLYVVLKVISKPQYN